MALLYMDSTVPRSWYWNSSHTQNTMGPSILFRLAKSGSQSWLEPIPTFVGREEGYSLDRSLTHIETGNHSHVQLINPTTVGGSHTCREPTQTLSMQNPHRRSRTRVKPRTCLLWGNGANLHTAVPLPNIIIIFMNSVYQKHAQAETLLNMCLCSADNGFPC